MMNDHISIRQEHKDRTRQRILDAAIAMLRESAVNMLTMARVAARAGVTERTVYRHFRTRDTLLRTSWASLQGKALDSVRAALPDLDDCAARRRAATVQLIRSAHGRSMLRELGLDCVAAGEAASEAVAILLGEHPAD